MRTFEGFYVAMDDAATVREGECAPDGGGDFERIVLIERPALTEDVGQRTALDVLDDNERLVGGLDEVENPENVRMREGAGLLRFARERLLRPPRRDSRTLTATTRLSTGSRAL